MVFIKIAVITGASGGIGGEVATLLSAEGYGLILGYHQSKSAALALCAALPSAVAICADVSTSTGCETLVSAALQHFGKIDLLVNNAGLSHIAQIQDTSVADFDRVFDHNIKSAYFCSKYAAVPMISAKSGVIINISSMWGLRGASCETAYSAAKGAMVTLTAALAKELAPAGIRVNCVAPGVIDTKMNAHLSPADLKALAEETPLGRIGTAGDVAQAVHFLAHASFITGQTLSVDGGILL